MSISITSVTLDGNTVFGVVGATGVAGNQVRCRAFIDQTAASSEQTTTSDGNKAWAVMLTLNAPFVETTTYRVVAILEDDEGTDATVPPFFGSPGGMDPPGGGP